VHRIGRSRAAENVSADTRISEHRNLGVAFYKTAMYEEAIREFKRVTELRPGDYGAEYHLGLVALRQGRLDDAVRAFRLIGSRPGAGHGAFVNLAYALERSGRLEEARGALEEAERLAPNDSAVRLALGILALRRGRVADADQHFREGAGLWGARQRPAAFFHYAGLAAALRADHDRAVTLLQEGVAAHPHCAVLYNNLAVALERRGRHAEASAAADRGTLEDPTLPQLHKNTGDLLYRGGRYEEALDAYQRAVRHEPDLGGDVYLKMGNVRYRRRERDEALRCWERSLALAPDNPMARNNLETARRLG
ncbi:MAG TPA: tetratricopeptide repeat protein, partial [Solirubrobacteraceae bacterium]